MNLKKKQLSLDRKENINHNETELAKRRVEADKAI